MSFCSNAQSKSPTVKNNIEFKQSQFISSPSTNIKKPSNDNRSDTSIKVDMNEYNIFHIDAIIKNKLTIQILSLPQLEEKLIQLLNINKTDPQISILRKQIQEIENTSDLNYYIFKTSDLLDRYCKLITSDNSKNFVQIKTKNTQTSNQITDLIFKYVNIARNYIEIENYSRVPCTLACSTCRSDLMERSIDDESSFICMNCFTETKILDNSLSFRDADRINLSNRYTYSRRAHFIEAMKKHQGKHNIDPESLQIITNILLKEIDFHNLSTKTVTKDHIYNFLSEKRLNKHYDDLNLLYSFLTGTPCPEYSHLENTLLDLFEQQESALDQIAASDTLNIRLNSCNVFFKLYKLLQKVNYPIKKSDFFILKTKAKEDEHVELLRRAWDLLGWKWIP
jgi:hypothetical protein